MLFTKEYQAQQRELHKDPNYGVKAVQYLGPISMALRAFECKSLLDYGCGPRQRLKNALEGIKYSGYDIVEPFDDEPDPHDLVVAADVLEHIEPDCLDDVLIHIHGLALKGVFFSVHTKEAKKTLPDGRNAHLIQKPSGWWLTKIGALFELQQFMRVSDREFFVICSR